jgi:hypothetical protein
MFKTKDILKFAEKKKDPEDAAIKEAANIAARQRNGVWQQPTRPLKRRLITALLGN